MQQVKKVSASQGVEIGVTAHCGNGILYTYLADEHEKLVRITNELKQAAASLDGFFLIESAPLTLRKEVAILPPRNDYQIMRHLKAEFDPNNILNPGRLAGGLH